ncbi:hypothetical protein M758_11G150200 [Ceratodon purpureus]|nr:hypothetical protein M758_11G150200 [Ceratodon purpureus]
MPLGQEAFSARNKALVHSRAQRIELLETQLWSVCNLGGKCVKGASLCLAYCFTYLNSFINQFMDLGSNPIGIVYSCVKSPPFSSNISPVISPYSKPIHICD